MSSRILAILLYLLSCPANAEVKIFQFGLPNTPERQAILYTPKTKKSGSLLVVLHGGSRNAKLAMNEDSEGEWNKIAEDYGWLVLYPNGTTNQHGGQKFLWNDCRLSFGNVGPSQPNVDDVAYLDGLIKKIQKEEDLKNVFVTGHSNGGGMTFRMAMESSVALSAIAPMLMNLPRDPKRCKDRWTKAIPTAFLLGTSDPMVSFSGGTKGRSGTDTIDWLRKKNFATWEGKTSIYDDLVKDDGPQGKTSVVAKTEFGPSESNPNTIYFQVRGGGHQVPGPAPVEKWVVDWLGPKNRDLSVRKEVAKFFQLHTQKR